MAAGTYNLTIEKGVYFEVSFTLKDDDGAAIDITNYTFKSEIRRKPETDLIKAFTITKTNATGGTIQMEMTGANTSSLPTGKLKWDLIAKDSSNNVRRYLEGDVTAIEIVSNATFS